MRKGLFIFVLSMAFLTYSNVSHGEFQPPIGNPPLQPPPPGSGGGGALTTGFDSFVCKIPQACIDACIESRKQCYNSANIMLKIAVKNCGPLNLVCLHDAAIVHKLAIEECDEEWNECIAACWANNKSSNSCNTNN